VSSRILVVEDDPSVASLLERGLRLAGYEVDLADDAVAGEAHWRSRAYGVVILDVMLPGTSGVELCAHMRSSGDATPVVLLTAREDNAIRRAGLEAGASAHVTKPFAYSELTALIGRLAPMDPETGSPHP
jgi:two-component system OmpR family response regulator